MKFLERQKYVETKKSPFFKTSKPLFPESVSLLNHFVIYLKR